MCGNLIELKLQTERNRKRLLEIIVRAGAGHTGGDLSCLNMLTVLYNNYLNISPDNFESPDRDRFILSKGHCVEALYAVLESRGFISSDVVDSLGRYGSPLAGHPLNSIPGIEVNSGALGHGLSIGVGMALAARMDSRKYRTVVMMGDGEQAEGSIYEAAMSASHYRLSNLMAIIDRNGLQISGDTETVMALGDIRSRWESFGWEVTDVNGDDVADIVRKLESVDQDGIKPHLIVSHTTKGYGVSFMEGEKKWHHGVPSQEQYEAALSEIEGRIKEIGNIL